MKKLLLVMLIAVSASFASEKEIKDDIREVFDNVSAALSERNVEVAASYFMDEGMVKISGGKVLRGREEMSKYFHAVMEAVKDIHIEIGHIDFHIIDENNVLTLADEYITYNGETHKAIVSNAFVRVDGRWMIFHDHTSYVVE